MANLSNFNKIITLTTRTQVKDAYGSTISTFTPDVRVGARIGYNASVPGSQDGKRVDNDTLTVDVRDTTRTRLIRRDDEFSYRNEPWIVDSVNPTYFNGIIRLTARRDT